MDFDTQKPDTDARRLAMRSYLRRAPMIDEMATVSDQMLMVDLIIHALDETTEHALAHLARAKPMLQNPNAVMVMSLTLFTLVSKQMNKLIDDSVDTIAKTALRTAVESGDPELLRDTLDAIAEGEAMRRRAQRDR